MAVIASKRNNRNVRVFIPEKVRKGGVTYTQAYTFIHVGSTPPGIIITNDAYISLSVSISTNTIVATSPFSKLLLLTYLGRIVRSLDKSETGVFRVLRQPEEGYVPLPVEPNPDGSQPAPSDPADEAYYRGQAKIDFE
jgi:hypothetical protein